ncbi:MAG: CHASE domain-containing protein, partial [Telluria sp.]
MGRTVGATGPVRFALWAGGIWLALAVGIGLYLAAARTVDDEAQRRFDSIAQGARQRLDGAVHSYGRVLHNLAGLFNANAGDVSRQQFHRYVASMDVHDNYPAIESINFGAYLTDAQRDAFVAAVRNDRSLDPRGYPGFDIQPPGRRPDYLVLTYLEPMLASRMGVDMVANRPATARSLEKARDGAQLSAAARPMTIDVPRHVLALTLRLPVYRGGAVPDSVEGRRAAYIGSVGIGFSVPTLVQRALDSMGRHPVELQLYLAAEDRPAVASDLAVTRADILLYDSAADEAARPRAQPRPHERFETVLPVRYQGKLWKARFVATRSSLADGFGTWFPRLAFGCGFGATLLIYALFLKLYWSRRHALEQRVLLDLVLDNVDAYVYMMDRERRFCYVNAKTAEIAGVPAEAMIGRR